MVNLINTPEWRAVVKRLLKSEMEVHGIKYRDLSSGLKERFGVIQTEENLRQKISKGTLGTQLFLQLLLVIGVDSIKTSQIQAIYDKVKGASIKSS